MVKLKKLKVEIPVPPFSHFVFLRAGLYEGKTNENKNETNKTKSRTIEHVSCIGRIK